eukprot:m.209551 g.209551  ORF g.209551 m.209551 type:complete len:399 (+) comp15816_c0_seq33:651-1847(+)
MSEPVLELRLPAPPLPAISRARPNGANIDDDCKYEIKAKGLSGKDLVEFTKNPEKLLLIDARPYSDYVVGHILGSLSVRLSSLMTRRLAKGKLKLFDLVVNEQKEQFQNMFDKDDCRVVVYDASTGADGIKGYNSKNPLHVILKALDVEAAGKECFYLLGGFDSYKDTFPDEVHVPELVVDPSPILSLNLDDPISATIVSPSPHYSQDQNHPQSHIKRILSIKPSMILPCLYIGSRRDACDKELLKSLGITNIINATDDCPCHFDDDSSFEYLRIPVKDTWNQDLPSFFQQAFDFINKSKSESKIVMIHCTAGISRSSTLTIAYIMKHLNMNLNQAISLVRSKRSIIAPNLDFMGELMQFETTLGLRSPSNNELPLQTPASATDGDKDKFSFSVDETK